MNLSVIRRFNELMVDKLREKYLGLGESTDKKIFMLDLKTSQAKEIDAGQLNNYDAFEVDRDTINYYWLEYDYVEEMATKKITLFYKDVDWSTYNVHIIPGILQEWSRQKDLNMDEYSDGKVKCSEENVGNSDCRLFAEYDWYPKRWNPKDYEDGGDAVEYIDDYVNVRQEFVKDMIDIREQLMKYTKSFGQASDEIIYNGKSGNPRADRYKIMRWLNTSKMQEKVSVNFYKIVDIGGFGPCMILNCVSFEKGNVKNTKEANSPNDYNPDTRTVNFNYQKVEAGSNLENSIWWLSDISDAHVIIEELREYYKNN